MFAVVTTLTKVKREQSKIKKVTKPTEMLEKTSKYKKQRKVVLGLKLRKVITVKNKEPKMETKLKSKVVENQPQLNGSLD